MITKITSQKVQLPVIYLVENEEDFKNLPKGLPYIIGTKSELPFIRIFLEFQVLFRSCNRTGLPIKWLDTLQKLGYGASQIRKFTLKSGGSFFKGSTDPGSELSVEQFIEEEYLVDFDKLAELKILPKWLDDLKASIETNIIDEVTFDPTAFNKQMGLATGAAAIKHNMKNLLILDVSSSIPSSVAVTITNLAKLMSKKFYADVIVTSSQSVFIGYEEMFVTDVVKVANSFQRGNESEMFRKIVREPKDYNTVICFGDNDNPGNKDKENFNFKAETLYSLHTDKSTNNIAGYARWFDIEPKNLHIVKDWVHTIN